MTGKILAPLLSVLVHIAIASAQAQEFAQCGGIGWTGATTCVAGTSCVQLNPYFFQCLSSSSTGSGGSSSTSTSAGALPTGSSTAFTNTVAKGIGKLYFGSATDNPELPDTAYETILNNTGFFGQITPGNSMKWDATEPEEGVFTFSGGDQIANLARANGQLIRGHNCVWYNQLPAWVSNGVFTAAQLTTVIQNHCGTLVSHYAGEIYAWDVINEPFNDDGTWRSDVFFNTLGESFVSIALEAARAADPKAKLYINDYNLEFTGAKNTAMMNLIKSLKAAEVPVDGVGLQGHFIVGEVPSNLATILQGFVALGVDVAITELDVRMTLPETDALLAQQKADYQTVAAACKAVAGCVGITIWDYTDKYSWIPGTFPGQGAACPWDANFVRKPAYDGIIAGLSA